MQSSEGLLRPKSGDASNENWWMLLGRQRTQCTLYLVASETSTLNGTKSTETRSADARWWLGRGSTRGATGPLGPGGGHGAFERGNYASAVARQAATWSVQDGRAVWNGADASCMGCTAGSR